MMPKPKETPEQRSRRELDEQLNEQLEQSFPASDAPKITRRSPAKARTKSRGRKS